MLPLLFAGCLAGGEDSLPFDTTAEERPAASPPDQAVELDEASAHAAPAEAPDEEDAAGDEQEIAGDEVIPAPADGSPCAPGASCPSGYCVDGFCCDTACTSQCMACSAALKGGGADGVCGPIATGADPDQECADQGAASCGLDGFCNGNGGCERYTAGTSCHVASCTGTVLTKADLCDGGGTCVDSGVQECAPFLCILKGCTTTCASDLQCAPSAYCSNTVCIFKGPDGAACAGGNQCQSGHCADGVCCNSDCTGSCAACSAAKKGAGADGVCGPIAAGADPDNECPTQAGATCGTTGSCDGAGACQKYDASTICVAASCGGSVLHLESHCDGAGTCVSGGTEECAPFNCSSGACLDVCVNDAQCAPTAYCDAPTCTTKKASGAPCSGANQCVTGLCTDGVCCETACNGACEACSAAKKGGGADGLCGPILAGLDPDSECPDLGASTCGTTGFCAGNGTCALYPAGTECHAASCDGTMQSPADHCDGLGACVDGGANDCGLFACDPDGCPTSCLTDEGCVDTAFCTGSICVLKMPDGVACDADHQCVTGHCVDGVCCDEACDGLCEACTAAAKGSGFDGFCGPIAAETDPGDECAPQSPESCGNTGACDGAGQCALHPLGTSCAAATCAGPSSVTPQSSCDGSGACVTPGATDCGLYACGDGACKSPCNDDNDCIPSAYCDNHVCTEKPVPSCMDDCDGGPDGSVEPPQDGGPDGSVEPPQDGGADGSADASPDGGASGSVESPPDSGPDGSTEMLPDAADAAPLDPPPDGAPDLPGFYSCAASPGRAPATTPWMTALAGLSLLVLRRRRTSADRAAPPGPITPP